MVQSSYLEVGIVHCIIISAELCLKVVIINAK